MDIQDCGIIPCEFKVLVRLDESDVLLAYRRAGLATPEEVNERYRQATMTGRIIDMSAAAFSYHEWPEDARLPQVGDRVVFARYAGLTVKGRPRRNEHGREEQDEYRLINDKDIAGILEFDTSTE